MEAVFSFLPQEIHTYKVPFGCFLLQVLTVLNIRGVKESITVRTPLLKNQRYKSLTTAWKYLRHRILIKIAVELSFLA